LYAEILLRIVSPYDGVTLLRVSGWSRDHKLVNFAKMSLKLAIQSATQSASQWAAQPSVSQSVSQAVVSQSVSQSFCQAVVYCLCCYNVEWRVY